MSSSSTTHAVPSTDGALYARLMRQARPYWGHIAAIFGLGLLATPLALLAPLPLKIVVDQVVGAKPLPAWLGRILPPSVADSTTDVLLVAAALLVVVALFAQLQVLATGFLHTYTGERLTLSLRSRLFDHVQRLSLRYHDSKGSADSTYRIQYDAPAVQHVAIDGILPFVSSLVTLVAMLYVTARLDWQLAGIALLISPILFVLTHLYRKRLRSRAREVKVLESNALSVVQEVLTSLRVVQAFGQERYEQGRFFEASSRGLRARLRLALLEGGMKLLIGLTTAVGTAAVLFVGVRNVMAGVLTLGDLLLVMGYLSQIYEPLKNMSKRIGSLQSQLVSAERAFTLLDESAEVVESRNPMSLRRATGAVSFRDVSFQYDDQELVLDRVTFHVEPGTRVGVAGRTGAGKTTLMSLLARFYDPSEGVVLLDGVDLRRYRIADLRNQFAIVLQEALLFSTSIGENIAYARPGATVAEIVDAAKAANAHEFIRALPDGYDTRVGERGMRISGGERQRIALARAFLRDAPILILDEPTSAVDLKTEAEIAEAMERLLVGRTTFTVAHRLSTLERCDHLLVLDRGRLIRSTSNVRSALEEALVGSNGRDSFFGSPEDEHSGSRAEHGIAFMRPARAGD